MNDVVKNNASKGLEGGDKAPHIKPTSMQDLRDIAARDGGYFELLDAMRHYAGMLVKDLTQAEAWGSSDYTSYYRLDGDKNKFAFTRVNIKQLFLYTQRMQEKVASDTSLDSEDFDEIVRELYKQYSSQYGENNKTVQRYQRNLDTELSAEAKRAEQKAEQFIEIKNADNFFDLSRNIRNYLGTALQEVGDYIGVTREMVRQSETRGFVNSKGVRYVPNAEYMEKLLAFYKSKLGIGETQGEEGRLVDLESGDGFDHYAPRGDVMLGQLAKLKNLWQEEFAKNPNNSGGKLREYAEEKANSFKPYLAYLVKELGYNMSSFEERSGFALKIVFNSGRKVTIKTYEKIDAGLVEPNIENNGRYIKPTEFEKLEELFFKQLQEKSSDAVKQRNAGEFGTMVKKSREVLAVER